MEELPKLLEILKKSLLKRTEDKNKLLSNKRDTNICYIDYKNYDNGCLVSISIDGKEPMLNFNQFNEMQTLRLENLIKVNISQNFGSLKGNNG